MSGLAQAVHPIAAQKSVWSLWSRVIEPEVLPVARELGIGFVLYSPLGRGLMTVSIKTLDQSPEGDHRRNSPRFASENFEHNKDLVAQFAAIAADLGCTSGQLAIARLKAMTLSPSRVPNVELI